MTTEKIIQVEHLTMAYNSNVLIENLNFSVKQGEIFMILGGSGSGKSTLLRYLLGLEQSKEGRILLLGKDINSVTGQERQTLLQEIGVTYQSGALFGSMTLLENVRLPLEEFTALPKNAMNELAKQKLKLVGLAGYEDYLPSEISGGMQKRAGMARALALDPKIMFLDEPSAGLDPISSLELDELILKLADLLNMTFVIVSHELASIFNIANYVIILDKVSKAIIAEGDPRELRIKSDNRYVHRFLNREDTRERNY